MRLSQRMCCILSKFYIKPQPRATSVRSRWVVSYRNSTSNHNEKLHAWMRGDVVSYRNSTSNHNQRYDDRRARCVVSYRNSTSNHNVTILIISDIQLYLIEILHQTTTTVIANAVVYVVSYRNSTSNHNCSLRQDARLGVVSYRNSTSNHNSWPRRARNCTLYLIEILHQTTTVTELG